jgi:hypothetical protein
VSGDCSLPRSHQLQVFLAADGRPEPPPFLLLNCLSFATFLLVSSYEIVRPDTRLGEGGYIGVEKKGISQRHVVDKKASPSGPVSYRCGLWNVNECT